MLDNSKKFDICTTVSMNYKLKILKEVTDQIWELYFYNESGIFSLFLIYLSVKWNRRSRENLEAFVWKLKRRFLASQQTDAL